MKLRKIGKCSKWRRKRSKNGAEEKKTERPQRIMLRGERTDKRKEEEEEKEEYVQRRNKVKLQNLKAWNCRN